MENRAPSTDGLLQVIYEVCASIDARIKRRDEERQVHKKHSNAGHPQIDADIRVSARCAMKAAEEELEWLRSLRKLLIGSTSLKTLIVEKGNQADDNGSNESAR